MQYIWALVRVLKVCISSFLRALSLCPWTISLVFAGFRSFFQLELFWPKTRFWLFREFLRFDRPSFQGGWGGGGGGNYVQSDCRHGKLMEDFRHSKLRRTPLAPLVTVLLNMYWNICHCLERLDMPNDIYIIWPLRLSRVNTASSERNILHTSTALG